jgi:hypothetical protein
MQSLLIFLSVLMTLQLSAQSANLTGTVSDSTEQTLPGATVVLLEPSDSTMVGFAKTNPSGLFELKNLTPKNYLLQITYLGFEPFYQAVTVKAGGTHLGTLKLTGKSAMLTSIEVLAEQVPLRMGGDTIEYNTAAFKVRPNDVAEDILRKMPGIEVERDGTIKAHGETVQNVLVDGKAFFGKDTRIATKNLPADAIDKVQVYDAKSDFAEFAGIEDGQDERTINLKLKPGKKHGHFGKADLGAGDNGRYAGKFNLNRFSPGTRISTLGQVNNTNEQGFSLNDYIQMMGGLGSMANGGKIEITPDQTMGIPLGNKLEGIQNTLSAGLNFTHDFSPRSELNTSYFYNHLKNTLLSENLRTVLNNDSYFQADENRDQVSKNEGHRLNLLLKQKLDASQDLKIRFTGSLSNGGLTESGLTVNREGQESLNRFQSNYSNATDRYQLEPSLVYRKRFKQLGRAFVGSAQSQFGKNTQTGDLSTESLVYEFPDQIATLLQRQGGENSQQSFGFNLAFTEPIAKRHYLKFGYGAKTDQEQMQNAFYDISAGNEVFNTLLSADFERRLSTKSFDAQHMLTHKKHRLTTGIKAEYGRLNGALSSSTRPVTLDYFKALPSLFYNYEFKTANRIELDYTTQIQVPNIYQLQPVVTNINPANIYQGNPNLLPEYVHEARLGYSLFDQFHFRTFFARVSGSYTRNKINNASFIDDQFRITTTPVNTAPEKRIRTNMQFSTPIKPLKITTKLKLNSGFTSSPTMINSMLNQVNRLRFAPQWSVENRNKEWFDLLVGMRYASNHVNWSVNKQLNQTYFEHGLVAELSITPAAKWLIKSEFDYTNYFGGNFGAGFKLPLWQAELTRYVLKNDKGRIKLSTQNILNRNLGLSRSNELNVVEQRVTNTLGRFFLLTFGYSISGFKQAQSGIEIKMEG